MGNAGEYSTLPALGIYRALYINGETAFLHYNLLGSSQTQTDYSGTQIQDMAFYPWGQVWWQAQQGMGWNFASMPYWDVNTNTSFTQFREYSMNVGRWYSPDPLGGEVTNPQSLNRYAYVTNNPATYIDPLGLYLWTLGECTYDTASFYVDGQYQGTDTEVVWCMTPLSFIQPVLPDILGGGGGFGGGGGRGRGGKPPSKPQTPTPAQAVTNYCQQHGQFSFNIPFTHIPVTISLSATAFVNFSTTNDVSATFPPSAGLSLDITVGAPSGPNIPFQVGLGKDASAGTFLTPNGPSGFSLSIPLGPVAGSPVTLSPNVGNVCGMVNGGGG